MISVLCPTRGRPEALRRSAWSLYNNWDGQANYEVLARVDDDDAADRVDLLVADTVIRGPRVGYAGMAEMYHDLAKVATGDWLLLWNDDAVMRTAGWDRIIEAHEPNVVLNPATNHGPGLVPFPVIPRWMVETLGHVAGNRHCDSWWQEVAGRLGILVDLPEVYVEHQRADLTGDNDDATYRERQYDPAFYGEANIAAIEADVAALRAVPR